MKKRRIETESIAMSRILSQENRALYTAEYFMKSGQKILEIAAEMETALQKAGNIPDVIGKKAVLWDSWRTLRSNLEELITGIQLLPNIQETAFRYWKISDVLLAAELAINQEDDEAFRAAIAETKKIGMMIDTAMKGASLEQLTVDTSH